MSLSLAEITQIRRATAQDPVLFCNTFLREWFYDGISWYQRGVLAILTRSTSWLDKYGDVEKIIEHFKFKLDPDDDLSPLVHMFARSSDGSIHLRIGQFFELRIPRGFGKTTIVNANTVRMLVFGTHKVVVYISETATHAEQQLKNIRGQLEGNNLLKAVFEEQRPDQRKGKTWADTQIECNSGSTLLARGSGAQIRGINVNGRRPDFIMMDDVETRESVENDALRLKAKQWLYNDVLPALDDKSEGSCIGMIGTLLHRDALLVTFERNPRVTTVIFAARIPSGEMLWPDKMSHEDFAAKREEYVIAGLLSSFAMEYMNAIRPDEGNKFPSTCIQYGYPAEGEELYTAIAIDPAISERKKSAMTAIAVVSISSRGKFYIHEAFGRGGMSPTDQVDKYFEFAKRYASTLRYHGVEAVAYQQALVHLLKEDMFRRGVYFDITEIRHGEKKLTRVEGVLVKRYNAKLVYHTRHFSDLENQLLDWPNSLLDLPDAVAMAISLLDPFAAQAADPEMDLGDNQYGSLESMIEGTFEEDLV